jgi:protein TonB
MSYFEQDSGNLRHACVFAGILVLHGVAIAVFWIGLADSGLRTAQTIFQIDVVPEVKPKEPPPRLPPVKLESQAVSVDASQIDIDIPVAEELTPPIQVTRAPEEPIAPASPLAPLAVTVASSAPAVRPRPIYVPGGRERYPAESIRAGETGTPTITICISATGAVDSVQVTQSSGFQRLDQAAVGIGKEARFKPARRDGRPVPLCVPYRIKFAMGNS